MSASTLAHTGPADRRRHPRRTTDTDLVIKVLRTHARIRCRSVDTSIGGMRVRSDRPIPLGPCDVIALPDTEHTLVLLGEVMECIEGADGASTARIRFLPVLSPSADAGRDATEPAPVAAPPVEPRRAVRRSTAVLAASIAAGLLVAAGAYAATRQSAEASPPAAAATARVERADTLVHVHLGTTPEDTSASSFVGPADAVDRVRVELDITPEPEGTTLPLDVRVENRGDAALRFADGLHATITATRADGTVTSATFTDPDITEVAPGGTVSVGDRFDFGATGDADLTVEVDVAD